MKPRPERDPDEILDLSDLDELETLIGETLRDWELKRTADVLGMMVRLLTQEMKGAEQRREDLSGKNDLRAEGYEEGRVNAFQTIIQQVEKAQKSRLRRIGKEDVRSVK